MQRITGDARRRITRQIETLINDAAKGQTYDAESYTNAIQYMLSDQLWMILGFFDQGGEFIELFTDGNIARRRLKQVKAEYNFDPNLISLSRIRITNTLDA